MFWEYFKTLTPESIPYSQIVNFENVQNAIASKYILINTFPVDSPFCVIKGTVTYRDEERIINEMILSADDTFVIIYGKNISDSSVIKKYKQMTYLGLTVYIYPGGIFEWLSLQDIYGIEEFPTENWRSGTYTEILSYNDILSYKPDKKSL